MRVKRFRFKEWNMPKPQKKNFRIEENKERQKVESKKSHKD